MFTCINPDWSRVESFVIITFSNKCLIIKLLNLEIV